MDKSRNSDLQVGSVFSPEEWRGLKRTERLKLNKDFRRLYARGKSLAGGFVAVYAQKNRRGINRVGFTVGKQLGNAVIRNRAKRLMRESYRQLEGGMTGSYDMVIVARNRAAGKTYQQILRDMKYVLASLGVLGEES